MVTPRQAHRPPLRLPLEAYTAVTTATYTAKAGDRLIGVNRAGAVTITLPAAEVRAGRIYTVKDESGNAFTNKITVATEGSETIDGTATNVISDDYGAKHYYSDGSNWFVIPIISLDELMSKGQWWTIANYQSVVQTLTGSGTFQRSWSNLAAITGTTASSTAKLAGAPQTYLGQGKNAQVVNWSKQIILIFPLTSSSGTTNGKSGLTLGKNNADGVGALTDKGIGIRIDNLALKGIAHDGTSETTVDLSITMNDEQVYTVKIVSDGTGNVEWFIDGVSKGTTSSGPTGDSTFAHSIFQLESDNGGDAADQTIKIGAIALYAEY